LSENKKWVEPRIEWLNLENEGCSEHVAPMALHELLKLFPRRREPFEQVGVHIEVADIHA
jgi:hypothetical protein